MSTEDKFSWRIEEVPIVMLLRYRCSLIQRLTQNDPLKDILL